MTDQRRTPPPIGPLRSQLCEVAALEHYLIELLALQQVDSALHAQPEMLRFISRVLHVLHQQASRTVALLETIPGGPVEFTKTTVAMADRFQAYTRKPAARDVIAVLQEDYTLLNLVAMNYTMLHTTALALNDPSAAGLALNHLREITPLVLYASQLMPTLAFLALEERVPGLNRNIITAAVRNTQNAWRPAPPPPPQTGGSDPSARFPNPE
jgi:hypothetical protein